MSKSILKGGTKSTRDAADHEKGKGDVKSTAWTCDDQRESQTDMWKERRKVQGPEQSCLSRTEGGKKEEVCHGEGEEWGRHGGEKGYAEFAAVKEEAAPLKLQRQGQGGEKNHCRGRGGPDYQYPRNRKKKKKKNEYQMVHSGKRRGGKKVAQIISAGGKKK